MNDEKIVLVQQLKDKSYIAVLNDEYRFDGSVLVEASNEEEVNVPPPIEAEASCFSENSTTNSEEL